ncbi:MAG: aldehyde dehydrogenase family protein [Bacteroidetes bacterium]|nr:aldehyde dehydrogenase family protein [Bacteroidota bacterium]
MSRQISTFNCKTNSVNPATFPISSWEELDEKIALASEVHRLKIWQNSTVRVAFFASLCQKLQQTKSSLKAIYMAESSLNEDRFEREFQRMIRQIKAYSKEGLTLQDEGIKEVLVDRTLEKRWIPLGPAAVFGASNFPLAYGTLGGDTIGALATGCPVIVKGHPLHAGTSTFLADIALSLLDELKLARGIFSHVLDDGFEIGQRLIQDSRINVGAFTGSLSGGTTLFQLAQDRKSPIPFFAEMGSLNPVIIGKKTSNTESFVQHLATAITEDAGQFCTKPGLILIPTEDRNVFEESLTHHLQRANPFPMLHPSIYEKYNDRLAEIEKSHCLRRFEHEKKWYADPAISLISAEEFMDSKVLHQEVFGPFACLVSYDNVAEIQQIFSCIGGQLTTSIIDFHSEAKTLADFVQNFSGRIIFNGVPTGVVVERGMHHGGPFPSTTDVRFSSVGEASLKRFIRPICIQTH